MTQKEFFILLQKPRTPSLKKNKSSFWIFMRRSQLYLYVFRVSQTDSHTDRDIQKHYPKTDPQITRLPLVYKYQKTQRPISSINLPLLKSLFAELQLDTPHVCMWQRTYRYSETADREGGWPRRSGYGGDYISVCGCV